MAVASVTKNHCRLVWGLWCRRPRGAGAGQQDLARHYRPSRNRT